MAERPEFFTYILTNADRTVLYVGVTNNMKIRLIGHWISTNSFVSTYKTYYLLWFESTRYVLNAIRLEKQLKGISREKKVALIREQNPDWKFRNAEVAGIWPPTAAMMREVAELYARFPEREWQ